MKLLEETVDTLDLFLCIVEIEEELRRVTHFQRPGKCGTDMRRFGLNKFQDALLRLFITQEAQIDLAVLQIGRYTRDGDRQEARIQFGELGLEQSGKLLFDLASHTLGTN